MKQKIRKFSSILCIAIVMMMLLSVSAFAAESKLEPYVSYSIDAQVPDLEGTICLSSDSYIENGRLITTEVYQMPDGTIITDTLNRSAFAMYSSEGSDTVTRTKKISGWGSFTLTGNFDWYTEGMFSYVRCSSASGSHDLDKNAVLSGFNVTKSEGYIKLGTAYAKLAYKAYNKQIPAQGINGSFKITCSDDGKISDNA